MLNSLANHNLIKHSGKNISKTSLVSALQTVGVDKEMTGLLLSPFDSIGRDLDGDRVLDLDGLQAKPFEHDASMSRLDSSLGDAVTFNRVRFNWIRLYAVGGYVSLDGLARYRNDLYKLSKDTNPDVYFSTKHTSSLIFQQVRTR
jgi:hypothetical protein